VTIPKSTWSGRATPRPLPSGARWQSIRSMSWWCRFPSRPSRNVPKELLDDKQKAAGLDYGSPLDSTEAVSSPLMW